MRRPVKNRKHPSADHKHDSVLVSRLINYVMLDGKKSVAERIVYEALDILKEKTNENPVEVLETAIKNASPTMEVRSRRVGGANYQVPREVRPERRVQKSLRWILEAARSGSGNGMEERLAAEILSAYKGEGIAVKKKENTHKMAEANKAFAHFSW